MPDDKKRPLATLISLEQLPEGLGSLQSGTPDLLYNVFYKNLSINRGENGYKATYHLKVVLPVPVKFELFGTGLFLMFNPPQQGADQTTEMEVEFYYRWLILKYLAAFDLQELPADFDGLWSSIQSIFGLSDAGILESLEQAAPYRLGPIAVLVPQLNSQYGLAGTDKEIVCQQDMTYTQVYQGLTQAGITLEQVTADFDVAFVEDPEGTPVTPETILSSLEIYYPQGAMIDLINYLNNKYQLAGTANEIAYVEDSLTIYEDILTSLEAAGYSVADVLKDTVIDISSFETIKDSIFKLLGRLADGETPGSFEDLFLPDLRLEAFDLTLALEFSRTMLIPLDEQGNALPDPNTAKLRFTAGSLRFSTASGYEFNNCSSFSFDKAEIMDTGLTLEIQDARLDLYSDRNIPEADAEGRPQSFRGICVTEAVIGLPSGWEADSGQAGGARIIGRNLIIGSEGGFSGSISLDTSQDSVLYTKLPGGIKAGLDRFNITLVKNSVTGSDIAGKLSIPGLKDATGLKDAELLLEAGINGDTYSFSATVQSGLRISDFTVDLEKCSLTLSRGNLETLDIAGILTLPGMTDVNGQAARVGFVFAEEQGYFKLGVISSIPAFELGGFGLALNSFALSFNDNGIHSLDAAGSVCIPGISDGQGQPVAIDVAFGYNGAAFELTASGNIPPLKLGGFALELSTFSITFDHSGVKATQIEGQITVPGLDDEQGNPAPIGVNLEIDGDEYSLGASADIPPLKLGGFDLKLSALAITFNDSGIKETQIEGIMKVPAFKDSQGNPLLLDISISVEDHGFEVTAKIPSNVDALTVLDIENVVKVELRQFSLGQSGPSWHFKFAGAIYNRINLPVVGKFLPESVKINDFQFKTPQNDTVFDMAITWPEGPAIAGNSQSGLNIRVPVSQSVGPGFLDALQFSARDTAPGVEIKIILEGAGFNLGPLVAVVDGIGVKIQLTPADHGNMGPLHVGMGIVPPRGLGMSLKTSVITGGGYLMFDPDAGQYAGALELSFQDKFSLAAIGILTTKMPDGSKGFSLLIIITAQFPPITLGFGFFLNGVGGLLGLNRSMEVDAMRQGVQRGSVDHILFPQNVIGNITQIISDLQSIFPPTKDQFIIGPMALITWSNPAIISIKLGLLIEFPNPVRLNILGVLRAALPPVVDTPLVQIQVNFFGCIDFQRGFITFDASLFDSYLGYNDYKFSLAGDMALRIFWGDQKEFLFSVGGFHPAFKPSANLMLPKMQRLTLSLLSGNPHLTLTTYFALTSNTVQFGSAIDFYYEVSGFKITGYFGFDVLFQFSPFYFLADMAARLAVEAGGTVLFSIGLDFSLRGPSPWHAKGTAEFKVLCITYQVDFDKTFGEKQDTALPPVEVMPQLLEAFNQPANWRNESQAAPFTTVSLRESNNSPNQVLLHGHDILTIHQSVLPLDTQIDLFGHSTPQDIKLAAIDSVAIGVRELELEPVEDLFSPALFKVMSDSDKLKAPSFIPMPSGVKAKGMGGMNASYGRNCPVEYDILLSDEPPDENGETQCKPESLGTMAMPKNRFTQFIGGGAVSRSPLSKALGRQRLALDGKRVKVSTEAYTVVFTGDLKPFAANLKGGTRAQADDALRDILKDNPDLKGKVQITPEFQADRTS